MNTQDAVYGNIYLISNILSNIVELETVVDMNRARLRRGAEKITDRVTKLDLKWSQRDHLPKFKNLKELVIHMDPGIPRIDDYKTYTEAWREYESDVNKIVDSNKLTSLSIFAAYPEVSLRSYMLPSKWYQLEYINFGDTVAYRRDTNTFIVVDDPFHSKWVHRFVATEAVSSLHDRLEAGGSFEVNLVLYTNDFYTLELALQRRDQYKTILVRPLEGSKYADYATLSDRYHDRDIDDDDYEDVKLEGFEFFDNVLVNDLNGVSMRNWRRLSVRGLRVGLREGIILDFFKQISTHPDMDKIIVSYQVYDIITANIDDEDKYAFDKQLDLVKKVSKYIPITLDALESLHFPSRTASALIANNIIDLEYAFKLYEYLPRFLLGESKLKRTIDTFPSFQQRIIDQYPEYVNQLEW